MNKKIEELITKKHIIIIGKTETERHSFVNEIIQKLDFEFFRFPSGMTTFKEYITIVEKNSLFLPFITSKGKYNINQIFDFHIDWISENNSVIILEEFQKMEENWRIELLRIFIEKLEMNKAKSARLIISQKDENNLIDKLNPFIHETTNKSNKQIIDSNLIVIDIS